MKQILFAVGLIISGSIGVAMGNLEETIFYTSATGAYKQSATYYMFFMFIILGIVSAIIGFIKKNNQSL